MMPFLLWASALFAQAPAPKVWLAELLKRSALPTAAAQYPLRLAVLTNGMLVRDELKRMEYPLVMGEQDPGLFLQLNALFATKEKRAQLAKTKPEEQLSLKMKAAGADTALVSENDGTWRVIRRENGKTVVACAQKPPAKLQAEDLRQWLAENLGYNGVVLDQRGDDLLVGVLATSMKNDAQALILEDSAGKFVFKGQEKKGGGLTQLVAKDGGVAVFRLLVTGGQDAVPVGTKLAIETPQN